MTDFSGTHSTAVQPERVLRWLDRFAAEHGSLVPTADETTVTFSATDGSVVRCRVPFPPLHVVSDARDAGLAQHALVDRRVGVVLVRLGGHAVGVFHGRQLVASKVGSRNVHGRSSAGGWSQNRFARRREGQVRVALATAADTAARVLGPEAGALDAVVLGGDRRAVATVMTHPRLKALSSLVLEGCLDVPDPKLRVLEQTPDLFRAVRLRISTPDPAPEPAGNVTGA